MKNQGLLTLFAVFCLVFFLSFFNSAYAQSQVKPIELKVASWNPPGIPFSVQAEKWGKMVEERSGGKVKLVFYWSETLVAQRDIFRAMQTGVADIGNWAVGTMPGIQPINDFMMLPLLGFDDSFIATKIYHELRKKFPEFDGEFKGLKNIYSYAMPPYQFHFPKKTVRVPDDVRGLKIMCGASMVPFINAIGAAPVVKAAPDWYMSLQKGLVDGHYMHWVAVGGFKLNELLATHTEAGEEGFGTQIMGWWMNNDTWNKLPAEAQKAFMDLQSWIQEEHIKINLKLIEKDRGEAIKMGHSVIKLTKEEKQPWANAAKSVHDKWIADMEAKKLPGRAIYDETNRLIFSLKK